MRTANEIILTARSLPPDEKLKLIEELIPGIEPALRGAAGSPLQRGLRELLLKEMRRNIFATTPRREFFCPARPPAA